MQTPVDVPQVYVPVVLSELLFSFLLLLYSLVFKLSRLAYILTYSNVLSASIKHWLHFIVIHVKPHSSSILYTETTATMAIIFPDVQLHSV